MRLVLYPLESAIRAVIRDDFSPARVRERATGASEEETPSRFRGEGLRCSSWSALTVVNDDGLQRVGAHSLETGARAEERYSILPDDPLSAEIEARWTIRLGRDAWQVRTETFARMTAPAESFTVTARLDAYEGVTLVAKRCCNATLPRDHV